MSQRESGGGIAALVSLTLKRFLILGFGLVALSMTVYATWGGASSFLPEWYAAVGVTVMAAGFLVFTSMAVGDGLMRGRFLLGAVSLPFYIAAVVICWVFSFASYHSQFLSNAGSDLAQTETTLTEMREILRPLPGMVAAQMQARERALLEDDRFEAHIAAMRGFAARLEDPDFAAAVLEQSRRTARAALEDNRVAREAAMQRLFEAEAAQAEKRRSLEEVERRAGELGQRAAAVEQRIASFDEAIALEEGSGDPFKDARLAGDGPASTLVNAAVCRRERVTGIGKGTGGTCHDILSAARERLRGEAQAIRDEAQTLEQPLAVARQAAADAEADTAALRKRADELDAAVRAADAGEVKIEARLGGLADSLAAKPDPATFDAVAQACKAGAQHAKIVGEAVPDCAPAPVAASIAALVEAKGSAVSFAETCSSAETTAQGLLTSLRAKLSRPGGADREQAIAASFDAMRAQTMLPCIAAAEEIGVDAAGVRAGLIQFYDRNNPSQDAISQATAKIYALFSGEASARDYFPALVALLQELSLLAAKLFWELSGSRRAPARAGREEEIRTFDLAPSDMDSEPVAAAKQLLRAAVQTGSGIVLRRGYDNVAGPDLGAQMRLLVGSLKRRGLARRSKLNGAVHIADEGVLDLERMIREAALRAARRAMREGARPAARS